MQSLSTAVARRLTELKIHQNKTDEGIGIAIGVGRSTIQRMMTNKASMDLDLLDMVANHLGTDIVSLLELAVQDAPVRPAHFAKIRLAAKNAIQRGLGKKGASQR